MLNLDIYPGHEYIYYSNEYKVCMGFSSGSYAHAIFPDGKLAATKLHEGIFLTVDDEFIIATHSDENGEILHYDEIIEFVNDQDLKEYPKHIHCCYQKQLAEKHSELKEYLFLPDCDLYTGTGMLLYHFDPNFKPGSFCLYKDYLKMLEVEAEKRSKLEKEQ